MRIRYIFLLILMIATASCAPLGNSKRQANDQNTENKTKNSELSRILESRELNVVVDYNSTNYFVYRGQPMGFQYELLKAFADEMGLGLKIHVSNRLGETFEGLNSGKYDLVAKNLTVTKERSEQVNFTEPLALTRQVLVQKIPEGARSLTSAELDHLLVREQLDLAGKTIHVQRNTVYVQRLKHLSDEIGENIHIVEDTIYGVEQLISLVANGTIEYTICDENVAQVNQKYYPWIDIATPISFNQKISWAVRKDAPKWKALLDDWITSYKATDDYKYLYYKYFSGYNSSRLVRSEFHSISGGMISEYDYLIREIAEKYKWDWRLVASIIMQESNFDQYAESWMGAMGLMQLMPKTAELYNIEDITDPKENIRGGLEYLTWLDEVFAPIIRDSDERLKFVLASYNVGIGHVMDARKLAMKYGRDPNVWKDQVDFFILKKSIPQYYNDPVVKWGYCRGEEPYQYVIKVLDRYQHYLNVLPDGNNVALVSLPVQQASWK
ncbi:MAG: transporter substrate-binding domain-containing protein [Prolixibacteraceae bacterium]|nr:transporter substrate-binding domain-containing protein [Prolixibacteraceae bacterium]